MPRKAFELAVELEIHAVTCPGVWLCPSGQLTLCIFMLDSCAQTTRQEPIFPILYHEMFVFYKTFHSAHSLADLQEDLSKQFLYAELVQWIDDSEDEGSVLANFQTSLADLLYPSVSDRGLIAGVDIDLLMEPCKCFPGIIAPKIEVSTKTTIREVVNRCKNGFCSCQAFVVNPKTIPSRRCCKRGTIPRQRVVCHTSKFHRNQDKSEKKHCKVNTKPQFVINPVEPRRNCGCRKPIMSIRPRSKSRYRKRDRSPEGDRSGSPNQSKWKAKIQLVSDDADSSTVCDLLRKVRLSPKNKQKELVSKCLCTRNNNNNNCPSCPVCEQYRKYFDCICPPNAESDNLTELVRGPIKININEQPLPLKPPCSCPPSVESSTTSGKSKNENYDNGVTVSFNPKVISTSGKGGSIVDEIHVKVDSLLNSHPNLPTRQDMATMMSREPSLDRKTGSERCTAKCQCRSGQSSSRSYNTANRSEISRTSEKHNTDGSTSRPITEQSTRKICCTCNTRNKKNEVACICNDQTYKSMFYKNLERFYKNLYQRARRKAMDEMTMANIDGGKST